MDCGVPFSIGYWAQEILSLNIQNLVGPLKNVKVEPILDTQ